MQRTSFLSSLNRPISPPSGSAKAPIALDVSDSEMPPAKRQRLSSSSTASLKSIERRLIPSPFQLTKIQDVPDHENSNTVSLHDILGNPLIREAWIFNYVFDIDWTMQHFDPDIRNTVAVKIIHGSWKSEDRNKQGIDDACRRWPNVSAIQVYLPDAFGTHHTKMIVLFRHDDIAEVIIHTANMQAGDWTYATQAAWRSPPLELVKNGNSNWVPPEELGSPLELVKGASPHGGLPEDLRVGSGERFKWDYARYLKAYGKKLDHLVTEISKYDFSEIRGALIGSVPSRITNVYAEDNAETWGHPAVYHTLKHARGAALYGSASASNFPHIVAQCSSVATLNAGWLEDTLLHAVKSMQPNAKHSLSIVYPTAPDIARSQAGYSCGGSIHMKIATPAHQKQVTALFPHLCRWTRSTNGKHALRENSAPHIKTYISFENEPTTQAPTPAINWALLTSANLSIHAWGTEPKMPTAAKGSKKPKFNAEDAEVHIQSYELGVLVWPDLWADAVQGGRCAMVPTFGKDMPSKTTGQAGTVVGLRMPYDLPLTKYTTGDVPWSPGVPHPEPDRYGRTYGC